MNKVGSLFAGIGGFDLGFKNAGFKIAWANEFDKFACQAYRANHDSKLIEGDIQKVDPTTLEPVDVLTAGFPCQPFSISGNYKGVDAGGNRRGFEDANKGNMFFEVMRFVDVLQPRVIVLENVVGITNHDEGRTVLIIEDEIMRRGYVLKAAILGSDTHGNVPQMRKRWFLVAFKNVEDFTRFNFPCEQPLTRLAEDMLDETVDNKFYYTLDGLGTAGNFKGVVHDNLLKEPVERNKVFVMCGRRKDKRGYVTNRRGIFYTLTVSKTRETGVHDGKGWRLITPREALRLQGFPDNFEIVCSKTQTYKQAGNSVTVSVIERIANNVLQTIQVKTSQEVQV